MTIAALVVAIVALAGLLAVVALERRHRRQQLQAIRQQRNGGFVAWDWPTRPIDGHDHPEPPELLEEEPAS